MSTTTETTLHSPDLTSQAAPKSRAVLNHVGAKRLAGKIAIVTGGSTGMGADLISRAFSVPDPSGVV
jgi:hypothetical protein